jgi:hypothetical protein
LLFCLTLFFFFSLLSPLKPLHYQNSSFRIFIFSILDTYFTPTMLPRRLTVPGRLVHLGRAKTMQNVSLPSHLSVGRPGRGYTTRSRLSYSMAIKLQQSLPWSQAVMLQHSRSYSDTIVKVPQMAESISEGTLKQFSKQIGDYVEQDEEIATIETDKVLSIFPGMSLHVAYML